MPFSQVPRHILIVEDDRDFAQSLADILTLHGFTAQIAVNLEEARTKLATESFPLVLCDMRLGNERGLDLLDHIHQQQLPCRYLVLTAYADTQMAIEALQKGAADFLRKPLEIPQLLASLGHNFELLDLEKGKQMAQEMQRRHEQELSASEERYRKLYREFVALLDGIPDALILFDADLKVVWANKGAEESFASAAEQLPGKHCRDLWGFEGEWCDNCLRETFAEGVAQEKVHHSAEGKVWGMKAFPIRDPAGEVVNVIQISTDLTEKINLREEANRASRLAALGEMAAGVAHEINNPNGMIQINLGMVDQALKEGREILDRHFEAQGDFPWGGIRYSRMRDEIPRLVTEMRDASQRIKRTVEELKGFSRRDLPSDFKRINLNECVENAVRLTAAAWKESDAEIISDLIEGLPAVKGVRQRIEQILINLIGNACQALQGKHRVIEVRTRFLPDGERVSVSVQDNGIGIPPENLERITDPFFTTRREVGGTGLGLSLSARMAKEHGGTLEFKSMPGTGTTVTLTLPVDQGGNE